MAVEETKSVMVIVISPENPKVSELSTQLPFIRNSFYGGFGHPETSKEIKVLDIKDGSLVDIVDIKNLYPVEGEPKYLLVPNTNIDICNNEAFINITKCLIDERISFKQINTKLDGI